MNTFYGTTDRLQKHIDCGRLLCQWRNLRPRFLQAQAFLVNQLEGITNLLDLIRLKTAPLKAHGVDSTDSSRGTAHDDIGRHVVCYVRHTADHRMRTQAQELVHTGKTAQYHPIINLSMP